MAEFKDWFVPVISSVAALLGVFNVYLNNKSQQDIAALNSRIVQVGEARKFASDIMQRFDSVVVDKSTDRSVQIARLSGLLALANLMTQKTEGAAGLDVKGVLAVIEAQAASYKEDIAADLTKTATDAEADKLQAQYARVTSIGARATTALNNLDRDAASTSSGPASPPPAGRPTGLRAVKVDIFWCAGKPESGDLLDAASRLLAKRPADSLSPWKVRALTAENQASGFYNVTGQVIRIDSESERTVANELAQLAGGGFTVQLAKLKPTPGYLSAFLCPA